MQSSCLIQVASWFPQRNCKPSKEPDGAKAIVEEKYAELVAGVAVRELKQWAGASGNGFKVELRGGLRWATENAGDRKIRREDELLIADVAAISYGIVKEMQSLASGLFRAAS